MLNSAGSSLVIAESYYRNLASSKDTGAIIGGIIFGVIVSAFIIGMIVTMWSESSRSGKGWTIFWVVFALGIVLSILTMK